MNSITRFLILGLAGLLLFACTPITPYPSTPKQPDFDDIKDSGPESEIDTSNVPDAVPRHEARTMAGNKNPYTVLGKTYYLLEDESSYKERGRASWYGKKFHGRRTSNGEIYDMYAMTAAHKTLPIPSYVRVTNIQNGRSTVVRVNDRGPFHSDRIIDLSYAAAQRIGILNAGTGMVDVEIVLPDDAPPAPLKANATNNAVAGSKLPANTHLQIGAFSSETSAKQFAAQVSGHLTYPVIISRNQTGKPIFRVRVGPITDARDLQQVRLDIKKLNIPEAHVVYE